MKLRYGCYKMNDEKFLNVNQLKRKIKLILKIQEMKSKINRIGACIHTVKA